MTFIIDATPRWGAKRLRLFAVVRADQREEKAAWKGSRLRGIVKPSADEGGTEARSRMRRAVVGPSRPPAKRREQGVMRNAILH